MTSGVPSITLSTSSSDFSSSKPPLRKLLFPAKLFSSMEAADDNSNNQQQQQQHWHVVADTHWPMLFALYNMSLQVRETVIPPVLPYYH